jgi:hypothetical protein
VITLRTAGAKWLVDATRDGPTTIEGAAVSAEVVQTVADHLHDAKLRRTKQRPAARPGTAAYRPVTWRPTTRYRTASA